MLLKRLELQGFKSFADKTVLDFVEGSTAVVGPNGSGKSNISDAIRWVIGEMSAKTLRGSNMQDVIFAGTETRKPVNFAEVSLVLDNSTHMFNIDFDEVTVTRRLFRSGESVYQINRVNCRLKDIHEMFMDTGLGRDGYSIIGQGNVSQILSTKAEDRRSLFEEAAGISKYKYRKEDAEKKLKGVEENLVRIGDITTELEGQRAPLKRQSEKARKYLNLYEEFKGLDVNLSLVTMDKNKENLEETEKLYKNVEDELTELRASESEAERKVSALYDESKQKDEEIADKNRCLRNVQEDSHKVKNEITIAENNIKNNHSMLARIDSEISILKEKNIERENAIAKFHKDIKEKESAAELILSEFDLLKDEQEQIGIQRDALSEKIESVRSEVIEKLNEISSKKAQMSGLEALRSSFIERREVVEAELRSFNEDVTSTREDIEQCREEISQKAQKLEKMKLTVERHNKDISTARSSLDKITVALNSMHVDYNSKFSKKKILEGMENDYAGYAKSVKFVLKAEELKRLEIYGTVSGLVDVQKEYVTAIEVALGGALQNIIVESEEDAKQAIEFLRRNNAGRATFLPVTSVRGRELDNLRDVSKCEGFIGLANSLVRADRKYEGIIKSLLGRVVVVDNVDNAIDISRKFGYKFRIVTLEGDLLNAGGSMSGGSVNKQSGFLSRASEIKTLTAQIKELSVNMRDLNDKKQKTQEDIQRINNQLSSYIPLVREYEDEILRLENTLKHLEQSLEADADTEKNHRAELEQIEHQLSESSDEIAVLLQEIRRLEKDAQSMQDNAEEMSGALEKISSDKEEKTQDIMDKTMLLAGLEKDINLIKMSIDNTGLEIKNAGEDIKRKENDKENICQENDRLYSQINENKKRTQDIEDKSEKIISIITGLEEDKKHLLESLQNIQEANKDLTDKLLNLQQELSRLDNRREKLNSDTENILGRLWDNYELTYSTAFDIKTEVDDEKAAFARLAELKSEIKALGSVNVDSIEEYIAVEERFNFLTEQKNDLEKSKMDLTDIISSMEDLMEEHFGKQFADINESFSKVFKELFGGGKARLYMSEPNNVLESGIEIEVQLPGKGLQNINLYSGGEKSFIAIALLFAILRVKPAPFCILDEIDAALDDVNVSRFATYLKNYIEQTQFIVITHRRGSMEAANILYGVTMQEKGVSKLLSLHIDDVAGDMVS